MPQEILPPLPALTDQTPNDAIDPAFDPEDLPPELAFIPVEQRTKRWTGITDQKQRIFIAQLAATGAVSMAAKAIGHSTSALYQLRKRDGGDSFAAAWDRAVEAGARRVADLLMEYAIYGVPETWSKEGRVTMERRRPNIRAMQHIAAAHLPESFAGHHIVDGVPPSAVPHAVRRLRERWRQEWLEERQAEEAQRQLEYERMAGAQDTDLDDRLRIIRIAYQRKISHDPVKRAAWDMLTGPGTDWAALRRADAYMNPQKHEWHMHHPDMVLPLTAGAGNVDWDAAEGGDLANPTPPPEDYVDWNEGGREDELWFDRYAGHIVEGDAGESDPARGRIARGDLRMAAYTLRESAEGWQQARPPIIQHPHDFLRDSSKQGGPTTIERDAARRRAERAIAELEREWNAAYSE